MPTPALHPLLAPLAGFVGTFEGDGEGDYPTIEPFRYRERVVLGHVGKPFLAYEQTTWDPETGTPMHAERGYLRVLGDGRIELVLAHPIGIVEVQEGRHEGTRLELRSTTLAATSSAKEVHSLRRVLTLTDDVVETDLWMAYAQVPETHHLHSTLHRVC